MPFPMAWMCYGDGPASDGEVIVGLAPVPGVIRSGEESLVDGGGAFFLGEAVSIHPKGEKRCCFGIAVGGVARFGKVWTAAVCKGRQLRCGGFEAALKSGERVGHGGLRARRDKEKMDMFILRSEVLSVKRFRLLRRCGFMCCVGAALVGCPVLESGAMDGIIERKG